MTKDNKERIAIIGWAMLISTLLLTLVLVLLREFIPIEVIVLFLVVWIIIAGMFISLDIPEKSGM